MVQSLIKEFCPHVSKLYLFFYVLTFCQVQPTCTILMIIYGGVCGTAEWQNANRGHSITCFYFTCSYEISGLFRVVQYLTFMPFPAFVGFCSYQKNRSTERCPLSDKVLVIFFVKLLGVSHPVMKSPRYWKCATVAHNIC